MRQRRSSPKEQISVFVLESQAESMDCIASALIWTFGRTTPAIYVRPGPLSPGMYRSMNALLKLSVALEENRVTSMD